MNGISCVATLFTVAHFTLMRISWNHLFVETLMAVDVGPDIGAAVIGSGAVGLSILFLLSVTVLLLFIVNKRRRKPTEDDTKKLTDHSGNENVNYAGGKLTTLWSLIKNLMDNTSLYADVMSNLNRYFDTCEEKFELSPEKRIPCGCLKLAEPIGQGIKLSSCYSTISKKQWLYVHISWSLL